MDLMHRARVQVAELVRALRREIKDLKQDDEEDEDSDDEAEATPARPQASRGEPSISQKQARAAEREGRRKTLIERLHLQPLHTSTSAPAETSSGRDSQPGGGRRFTGVSQGGHYEDEDDEIVEISRPCVLQPSLSRDSRRNPRNSSIVSIPPSVRSQPVIVISSSSEPEVDDSDHDSDSSSIVEIVAPKHLRSSKHGAIRDGSDAESDSSSVVEVHPPDADEITIKRAFHACHYAVQRLEDEDIVPYGLRLFAYVALDLLLSTVRRKTSLGPAVKKEDTKGG